MFFSEFKRNIFHTDLVHTTFFDDLFLGLLTWCPSHVFMCFFLILKSGFYALKMETMSYWYFGAFFAGGN